VKKTLLHDWHVAAGARMTDFGGWDMPVQYPTGPREEHLRVRNAAGLFDVDHMGRFRISGSGVMDFIQGAQSWDVSGMEAGRAHYSLLCRESGGIIDDIFVYRLPKADSGGEWLFIVNASNREKDFAWLSDHAPAGVTLSDASPDTCMIALQGPRSREILEAASGRDLSSMGQHRITNCSVAGVLCTVCTTGYTGEPGFELLAPAPRAVELWRALLDAGAGHGIVPCGLAARDSLRAEACFPLYGHDIGEDTDPFSAGLSKAAVRMDGHDFIGKRALETLSEKPPRRRFVGFEMTEASVPRQGYPITKDGREAGRVTTGLFSPSTGRYLGMGYVGFAYSRIGERIEIVIRGTPKAARIVERPFYRSPHWGRKEAGHVEN
jgi:aminomethyltransferase